MWSARDQRAKEWLGGYAPAVHRPEYKLKQLLLGGGAPDDPPIGWAPISELIFSADVERILPNKMLRERVKARREQLCFARGQLRDKTEEERRALDPALVELMRIPLTDVYACTMTQLKTRYPCTMCEGCKKHNLCTGWSLERVKECLRTRTSLIETYVRDGELYDMELTLGSIEEAFAYQSTALKKTALEGAGALTAPPPAGGYGDPACAFLSPFAAAMADAGQPPAGQQQQGAAAESAVAITATCSKCKKVGHLRRDCPLRKAGGD
jgi:hypothetical protein